MISIGSPKIIPNTFNTFLKKNNTQVLFKKIGIYSLHICSLFEELKRKSIRYESVTGGCVFRHKILGSIKKKKVRFLFVWWLLDLWMAHGRTLEEKIIVGLFFIGMLVWWGYNEYKQDKSDD